MPEDELRVNSVELGDGTSEAVEPRQPCFQRRKIELQILRALESDEWRRRGFQLIYAQNPTGGS
jgi:hypothetical protein